MDRLVVRVQILARRIQLALRQVGLADRLAEPFEYPLRGRVDDQEVPVRGFELLGGHHPREEVGRSFAVQPGHPESRRVRAAHPPDRFVQRHIDVLAEARVLTRLERRQRPEGREHAAPVVGHEIPGAHGRAVRVAGHVRDPRETQCHPVESSAVLVGAGLAVATDPHNDEPAVRLAQGVWRQSPLLECAGPVVFDHDVGNVAEPPEEPLALRVGQVQGDRLLPAVVLRERDVAPVRVADLRLLDFDHFGAELPEERGAERCGEDLARADDAGPGECGW